MARKSGPLAQSDSKAKFFQALGLQHDCPAHRRLYSVMKLEAAEGRKRIIERYDLTNINETIMHEEVLNIYRLSSAQTRPTYDRGYDNTGIEEENWIIRWLLWHAFRYRDQRNNRNRHRTVSQATNSEDEEDDSHSQMATSPVTVQTSSSLVGQQRGATQSAPSTERRFWDPVRNEWQNASRGLFAPQ